MLVLGRGGRVALEFQGKVSRAGDVYPDLFLSSGHIGILHPVALPLVIVNYALSRGAAISPNLYVSKTLLKRTTNPPTKHSPLNSLRAL